MKAKTGSEVFHAPAPVVRGTGERRYKGNLDYKTTSGLSGNYAGKPATGERGLIVRTYAKEIESGYICAMALKISRP